MIQPRRWIPLFGLLLAALSLSACGAGASQTPTIVTVAPAEEAGVPTTRAEVPRITVEELKEKMDIGVMIVVGDTRSESAYEAGHINGAISFPASQVEARLNELDKDQEIILYCT